MGAPPNFGPSASSNPNFGVNAGSRSGPRQRRELSWSLEIDMKTIETHAKVDN